MADSSVKKEVLGEMWLFDRVGGECGPGDCHGWEEQVPKVPIGGEVIGGGPGVQRYRPV